MGVLIAMCGMFMAVVTGVFFVYRRLVRGRSQKVIMMDGAMCSVIDEQEAVIQPRILFNLVVGGVLSLFLIGLVALVVNSVIEGTFVADAGQVEMLMVTSIILGTAIYLTARRLMQARFHFDGRAGMLMISGRAGRTISLSEITSITRTGRTASSPDGGTGVQTIVVLLKDGQTIEAGTVSGPSKAAVERATQIVEVLERVTGAKSGD